MAIQGWNYKGLTFVPDSGFLEFIPMEEHLKNKKDPSYQPKLVLVDDLEVGVYELVFTNFHGGAFIRYRPGDLFEVISIGDEELNSELPQFQFYSRTNMIIDVAGLARFTEREFWKAIEGTGLLYQGWAARKEIVGQESILHLYIEPKFQQTFTEEEFKSKIDKELKDQVSEYKDLKSMLNRDPLRVTLLPEGAFSRYMAAQQEAGADLANVKPPHMKPSDAIMERLKQT